MELPEYNEMMFTLRYLRPGEAFLDVGANIGYYSLLAASVNSGSPVLGFEPHPKACEILRENALLNGFTSIRVIEAAVGEATGSCRLTSNLCDMNHITLDQAEDSVNVRLVTLDAELQRQQVDLSSVGLVKIDTEGFELHVLRGANSLLNTMPGPVWIVELMGWAERYGGNNAGVQALLSERGYKALRYVAAENVVVPYTGPVPGMTNNIIFARDPNMVLNRLRKLRCPPESCPPGGTIHADLFPTRQPTP